MPERNSVDKELYLALAKHNLAGYTDTLMDTLDDFVDWEPEEDVTWVDSDIQRDMKKTMPEAKHLEIELQELATRYQNIPQYLRDGLEQLIDACGHYTPPGGEP